MENLLKNVFNAVQNKEVLSEASYEVPSTYKTKDGNMLVYLSVGNKYTRAFVALGKAATITAALNEAIEYYHKYRVRNLKATSVKVDIVTDLFPAVKEGPRVNVNKTEFLYTRGEDGLMFSDDVQLSFLPAEVEAYRMIQEQQLVKENVFLAFEKHPIMYDQQAVKTFLTNELMDVYRFKTESYYYGENGYFPLLRGHRVYDELSKKDLTYAISLAKDNYFKQAVNNKGKIVYAYQPHNGSQARGYNILRHAGTTYSMLEVYEAMPDDNLMKAIKRAIKYLLSKVKDIEINGKKAKAVIERDAAKLGGNGLTIVALAKYTKITGDEQYLPLMHSLATWMGELQENGGKFSIHKQKYSTGQATDFVSEYYPGEAILAMVRLYQVDGDEKWLTFAENEANYLINDRDKSATEDTIIHDHWLLYALNDLYRARPKDMYLKHAFFIADAIAKDQRVPEEDHKREWYGSFKSKLKPGSTPVACRSEGLGAAYRMASDHGHQDRAATYKKALHEAIKFQLQMQLRPESVLYYNNKKLCLGAFHASLTNYELRNDYTQHNISSIIAYADVY